jgi:hypothetical protein
MSAPPMAPTLDLLLWERNGTQALIIVAKGPSCNRLGRIYLLKGTSRPNETVGTQTRPTGAKGSGGTAPSTKTAFYPPFSGQ